MTQPAKPWLPSSAITKTDEEAVVRTIVGHWASAWLPGASALRLTRLSDLAERRLDWQQNGDVWAGCEEDQAIQLGLALCADKADAANPRDRIVLAEIAAEVCQDLARRFGDDGSEAAPGSAAPTGQQVRAGFQLQPPDRRWSLCLALGRDAVIGTRRRLSASKEVPALGSLAVALGSVPCTLAAHLGTANLSAADLTSLEQGDVVMLDRAVRDPVPLAVAGHRLADETAAFEATDDGFRFVIAAPIA